MGLDHFEPKRPPWCKWHNREGARILEYGTPQTPQCVWLRTRRSGWASSQANGTALQSFWWDRQILASRLTVTRKRVNRDAGYGWELPCEYLFYGVFMWVIKERISQRRIWLHIAVLSFPSRRFSAITALKFMRTLVFQLLNYFYFIILNLSYVLTLSYDKQVFPHCLIYVFDQTFFH